MFTLDEKDGALWTMLEKVLLHPDHFLRSQATWECVWSDEPLADKEPEKIGRVLRLSGVHAFLATAQSEFPTTDLFVAIFWRQGWESLSETQREAIIDLIVSQTKCWIDSKGNDRYGLAKPDLILMSENIRRHGIWCESHREGANTIRSAQTTLFEDEKIKITLGASCAD